MCYEAARARACVSDFSKTHELENSGPGLVCLSSQVRVFSCPPTHICTIRIIIQHLCLLSCLSKSPNHPLSCTCLPPCPPLSHRLSHIYITPFTEAVQLTGLCVSLSRAPCNIALSFALEIPRLLSQGCYSTHASAPTHTHTYSYLRRARPSGLRFFSLMSLVRMQ